MTRVGIEAIHPYVGQAVLEVRRLFEARRLNLARFDNLSMKGKSVGLPCEDPVTNAVNAAKPIVSRLTTAERDRIELLITASESGVDFSKCVATYAREYLGLSRRCRVLEAKQACYAGTAAVHMAAGLIASGASPGAKALIIATDVGAIPPPHVTGNYAEPSMGAGAVAMLVGEDPGVFELDLGANGFYSYEVMDACRPFREEEIIDVDLSLLSYMDCLAGSFQHYAERVEGVDFASTFDYLAFHTPFAGLVRAAHAKMMRQMKKASPDEVKRDFARRLEPSLTYGVQVGNLCSGSVWLGLCGVLSKASRGERPRVGLFSYGAGCASEFFSGVVQADAAERLASLEIDEAIRRRYEISFQEYEHLLELNRAWGFGVRDKDVDIMPFRDIYEKQMSGRGLLVLKRVSDNHHREYDWS